MLTKIWHCPSPTEPEWAAAGNLPDTSVPFKLLSIEITLLIK